MCSFFVTILYRIRTTEVMPNNIADSKNTKVWVWKIITDLIIGQYWFIRMNVRLHICSYTILYGLPRVLIMPVLSIFVTSVTYMFFFSSQKTRSYCSVSSFRGLRCPSQPLYGKHLQVDSPMPAAATINPEICLLCVFSWNLPAIYFKMSYFSSHFFYLI